ncbi:MAG: acyl-CoA dehydrogenase family protein [Chloroflexi bacterium]|nr:acyl-CoA dehydrogenase family protein [Chloroflexota bacterium]
MTTAESSPTVESANFQAVLSRIADAGDSIERDRQIPQDVIDAMVDLGLFRLLVPRSVGGLEIDYLDYLAIVQAVASADGSTAWCFNQNNILGTMASLMPESLAQEIWSDSRSILCNGPPAHSEFTQVDGGYSVSGRWNFSSGSRHATWAVGLERIADPTALTCIIPKGEFTFIDTWQVNGLKGTGSFSFEAKDVFVPSNRVYVEAQAPHEDGALYLIPRSLFFGSGFGMVALGVARSALDAAIEIATRKKPQEQTLLRDQPAIQRIIGQAEATWGAANAYLQEKAAKLWQKALDDHDLPLEHRMELRLASSHAIRQGAQVADMAYSVFGSSAIFESSPIQRKFQDAHAITQQIQGRLEHYDSAGQYLLGFEPSGRMF